MNLNLGLNQKSEYRFPAAFILTFSFSFFVLFTYNNQILRNSITEINWRPHILSNLLNSSNETVNIEEVIRMKTVLIWNSHHRIEVSAFGTGHQVFIDSGCPVSNCFIQTNSSEFWSLAVANDFEILKSFDAVLVNVHELWLSFLPEYDRPAGQRLVWLTQESPLTTNGFVDFDSNEFDGLFNWTMTYKRDSDIQLLYGRFERIENQ